METRHKRAKSTMNETKSPDLKFNVSELMSEELTIAESKRLAQLESIIERTRKSFIEFGKALLEIRDSKLYRPQYSTFEQYCQGRWRFGRRYVNQVIRSSQAVLQLQDTQNLGTMVPKIQTERQARALADVPKDKRPEVLQEAEKSGKLTARSITEAAEKIVPDVIEKDKIGRDIPQRAMAVWNRRRELNPKLRPLYELKQWATDMQGSDDIFYHVRGFDFNKLILEAGALIFHLKQAIPDVVCTKCQGILADCDFCYGRGMISKDLGRTCTPVEMKNIIKKQISKNDSAKRLSISGR
jgi:hypothetical protein